MCWQKLEILHYCLFHQYREPEQLYLHLKRDQMNEQALGNLWITAV